MCEIKHAFELKNKKKLIVYFVSLYINKYIFMKFKAIINKKKGISSIRQTMRVTKIWKASMLDLVGSVSLRIDLRRLRHDGEVGERV